MLKNTLIRTRLIQNSMIQSKFSPSLIQSDCKLKFLGILIQILL